MNIRIYCLILIIVAGFSCVAASGRTESPPSEEKPLLINSFHPAFAGIEKLHVKVLQFGSIQEKNETFIKQLQTNVEEKLRRAGIDLANPTAANILIIPVLRIYINTLSLEDSRQRIFHIRTTLARAVCLKDELNPVFKAEIWQTIPVMKAVTAENMPARITRLVTEQVDGFIDIYKATNPPGKQLSDVDIDENSSLTTPYKHVEKETNSTTTGYKYIASSSSTVFHKPDCRWAGNISQENLVTYQSREEAIKAGKRPCKTCNP